MASRLELHEELCTKLGSRNVYFQPPESVKMNYPAIRYKLSRIKIGFANDKIYSKKKCYDATVIDKNPDSTIPDEMLGFPYCNFDRFYTADGLNHWAFTLYY